MQCPRCQQDNLSHAKFCLECGAPVGAAAPSRSYADLQAENVGLTGSLGDSLDQQTATSEILQIISRSPRDIQPVLDAIAASAARVCGAMDAIIMRVEGPDMRRAAHAGSIPLVLPEVRHITDGTTAGRAILERRAIHVHDVLAADFAHDYPEAAAAYAGAGWRTTLSVPLLSEGIAIGAITTRRAEVRPFTEKQITLLETFANQAVIAIENARLFNETKEALEQQTATADILRVISSSPTDVGPVLERMAESAARFCQAHDVSIWRVEGDRVQLVAHHGPIASFPIGRDVSLTPGGVAARTILERRPVHVADLQAEDEKFPEAAPTARRLGYRATLSVPLLRDDVAVGAIMLRRREAVPFADKQIALLQVFADQAVIAIENVRLFTELQEKNRVITEALERQTATSEILRIIASSPTDVQPVFETIVQSAQRLFESHSAAVVLRIGDEIHLGAFTGTGEAADAEARSFFPLSISTPAVAHVFIDGETEQISDVESDPRLLEGTRAFARRRGWRSRVVVPMHRDGAVRGAIAVTRREPGPFSNEQIAVLKTFADQAVIAIENVRLFTELQEKNRALTAAHAQVTESLEQQTATSEILRVMSASPTEIQPVFDAIVTSAKRLCNGTGATLFQCDGTLLHVVALDYDSPEHCEWFRRAFPVQLDTTSMVVARTITEGRVVHIADVTTDPDVPALSRDSARRFGYRSLLIVPMLRNGAPVGAIGVNRAEATAFSDSEIALLQTFADQAVIAIENVRLFKELQEKNRALTEAHAQVTEALEQQTATSEILRTIARAQTDVRPVFDTIARRAVSLCRGYFCAVFRFDGERLHLVAHHNFTPEALAEYQRRFPMAPHADYSTGRAILTRSVVHVPDFHQAPDFPLGQHLRRTLGSRAGVAVPMLRDGKPIGVINVGRAEPEAFTETEIDLLKTFADQAVIAIENARLFNELEGRTEELTRSVGELRALGEVGQAVSSTLDLETVLTTIVSRAVQLSGTDGGSIYEYDEGAEEFILRATHNLGDEYVAQRREIRLRKGEGVSGRMALTREPVEVPDITAPGAYDSRLREVLLRSGARAVLAVPLLREDHLIGGLVVNRNARGKFPPEVVELLKTFATQSALAIQNARLFQEIADKSRQLEAASRHKSEFLANMSHELRTPLNAILGFSEVLAQGMFGAVNEKQTEYLHDILESGRHLLSLINDILDLSKIEAGRMELEVSEFDLPQAIQNALTLVRERALRRGIRLHHAIDSQVAAIRADERKVKQVLLNLLSNAIKFTLEGGRIEVRAAPRDGLIEISVTDTGIGIAPEDLEAVFEEFRQVGTADKKAEGTGLGLALARKFIELHGGRIWVESEPGRGSTFTFTLPVA